LDCIDFGIALLDDCLDASPSFYDALCAYGFKCGYIDTGNPDHDINHGEPWHTTSTKVAAPTALGFLDIGTRAITSHEHSSASSTVQASTTLPLRLRGGVSPLVSTPLISLQFDRP
jgi:hypothetical protein